ncbi:MAG TPA: hypothetical protein VGD05_09590, partial [Pyrinomonadaceae bacterium]
MNKIKYLTIMFCVALIIGVNLTSRGNAQAKQNDMRNSATVQTMVKDVHSYSNPQAVKVRHVDLDWDVLFDKKILRGTATLNFDRAPEAKNAPLILDTRDLTIEKVETSVDGKSYKLTTFNVGAADKILGAPLSIELPAKATRARVYYSTS